MKKLRYLIALLLLCGVLAAGLAAFGRFHHSQVQQVTPLAQAPLANPLAIVLTPLPGDDALTHQIAELQDKIRQSPDANPLLERLGWAFVAKARISSDPGFYTLADQAAKAIRATSPDDVGALLLLGHIDHAMHRFAEAEAVARELITRREFVFDYALLGDALMEQGKLTEAVDAYQKMVDLKPCLQTYSRIAHIRWLKGDLRGAIAASRLAITGGSPREPEPIAWAYTRLAFYQLQSADPISALESLALATQFAPDYAPAMLMRGRALLAQGKFDEAIAPLRQAAETSPLPEYLWTLADGLRAAGQLPEAESVEVKLAATGATADPRTYALFLASRGENAPLALQLAKSELSNRQDVFTYDALAWSQLESGALAEAQESMRRALAEGTQDARLFLHAGTIAAAAGDAAAALEFFNKAHALEQTLLPSERHALGESTAALATAKNKITLK